LLRRDNQSTTKDLPTSEGGKTMATQKTASRASSSGTGSRKSSSSRASSGRKDSRGASKNVEREMASMKEGKLRSGSGRKVTNPKQAIAIGLSEARKSGEKVPGPPKGSSSARSTSGLKKSTRSTGHRSTTGTTKRSSTGRTSAKSSTRTKRSVSKRKHGTK